MKKINFAALLLLAALTSAQTYATPNRSKGTQRTRTEKFAAREKAYQSVIAALRNGDFIFQIDKMASEHTHTVADVDSTANFIIVKANDGVLQIAPPTSQQDATISCRVQHRLRILDKDLTFDKHGNATCKLEVMIGDDPQTITIELNKRRLVAIATTRAVNTYALLGKVVPTDRATIEAPRIETISEPNED